MALVKIGQLPPGTAAPAKKGLRLGIVQRLGGEVTASAKRIGAKTEQASTSAARAHLRALEQGVEDVLRPGGGGGDAEAAETVSEDTYEQLAGMADYIGGLVDAGALEEAAALVGELESVLEITKTATMSVKARKQPPAPVASAPAAPANPSDEGPIAVEPAFAGVGYVAAPGGVINPAVLAQHGPAAYGEPEPEGFQGPYYGGPVIIRRGFHPGPRLLPIARRPALRRGIIRVGRRR